MITKRIFFGRKAKKTHERVMWAKESKGWLLCRTKEMALRIIKQYGGRYEKLSKNDGMHYERIYIDGEIFIPPPSIPKYSHWVRFD